jgi:hypothetical protein
MTHAGVGLGELGTPVLRNFCGLRKMICDRKTIGIGYFPAKAQKR